MYRLMRTDECWKVYKNGTYYWKYSSLEKAKEQIRYRVNEHIREYVIEKRKKHPRRLSVEYYPW